MTTESNKLAKLGLLSQVADTEDRRRLLLEVTVGGHRRLHDLAEIPADVNDVYFGSLDAESFDQLRALMPQLVSSTDQALSLLGHLAATRSST